MLTAHSSQLTAHSMPVVFCHDNNQLYLKTAIKCAEKFNDIVVLLGNECNKNFCSNWCDTSKFAKTDYDEFDKLFVNMSSNSPRFEFLCFKRYFILYQYMCMNNIDCAMMLDSDVLCYVNCSSPEFIDLVKDKAVAFSTVGKWTGQDCGPQFLFCTRNALKSFIDFCMDMYKNHIELLEKKYHDDFVAKNQPGGICDMLLLSMWCQTLERKDILNWCEQDKYLIDHNINSASQYSPNQFRMDRLLGIKKMKYIASLPYFYDIEKKQWLRAHVLHFQGAAKKLMSASFYERPYIIKYLQCILYKIRSCVSSLLPKDIKRRIKKLMGRSW